MTSPLDRIGGRLFVGFVVTLITLAVLAAFDHATAAEITAAFGLFASAKAVEKHAHARVAKGDE